MDKRKWTKEYNEKLEYKTRNKILKINDKGKNNGRISTHQTYL